ncbi:hypothetical protein Q1695_012975 [Nippostrongylus brasiliensis]|nr:hypothetical protein Q1695_012975 [Nippostrongylus brasiliensis]
MNGRAVPETSSAINSLDTASLRSFMKIGVSDTATASCASAAIALTEGKHNRGFPYTQFCVECDYATCAISCRRFTDDESGPVTARLRAHLDDSTVLPALTYASESWALRKQDEHAICVAQRSIERRMLGVTRFIQARDGIRSSELRRQSKIRDAVAWAKLSKIRWAGHVMRFRDDRWTRAVTDWIPRDVGRTSGRPPLRWSDFFVKTLNGRFDALRVPRASRTHRSTMARERDEWRRYWRSLEQIDDQRDDR